VNREDGFAGSALKKDEFVRECSDLDDIIVSVKTHFHRHQMAEKVFVGKNVFHIGVFKKKRRPYDLQSRLSGWQDGAVYVKRFAVTAWFASKEYTSPKERRLPYLYMTANENGELKLSV
jgi:topoisomerase-4 subunit A